MTTEARASPDQAIPICGEADILVARSAGREMAASIGMHSSDQALLATAISEVARNIVQYAGVGEILLSVVRARGLTGIQVIARDQGPGIPDIGLAMQDGYSTGGSLGLGLPGAKRLVDEFEIRSEPGKGTTVILKKWAI